MRWPVSWSAAGLRPVRLTNLLLASVLVGGGPAASAGGEPSTEAVDPAPADHARPAGAEWSGVPVVELAVRDLAARLGLEASDVAVISVESVAWPDRGLGCPLPGAVYAPAVTPGYRISLETDGEDYTYHTDDARAFVRCRNGSPELPVIPVDPDDIKDGTPWMPVDPPPEASEP